MTDERVLFHDRQLTDDDTSTDAVLCDNMPATRLALPEVPNALVVADNLMAVRGRSAQSAAAMTLLPECFGGRDEARKLVLPLELRVWESS